mmetsp:Transcript_24060/g.49311  ORF Transcript_24060/g.49311 Transcript_24060/m.49311 type:complete len:96 (+) Transcript_24060:445-732(+)
MHHRHNRQARTEGQLQSRAQKPRNDFELPSRQQEHEHSLVLSGPSGALGQTTRLPHDRTGLVLVLLGNFFASSVCSTGGGDGPSIPPSQWRPRTQ